VSLCWARLVTLSRIGGPSGGGAFLSHRGPLTPGVNIPFVSLSEVPNWAIYTEPYWGRPTLVLFASNDGDWNEDSENSAVDCGDASFQVSVHLIRDQVYKLEERVTGHVDLSFVVAEQAIEPALNNLQVLHSMSGAGGCALPLPG